MSTDEERVYVVSCSVQLCIALRGLHRSQCPSGQRVRLRCEGTQVRISPQVVVFITTATAICSLWHGLRTSTAMSRSAQPCIPPGSLNRVPASAGVQAGMSPLPGGR